MAQDKTIVYIIISVVLIVILLIGFFVFRGQETSFERMRAEMSGDQKLSAALAQSKAQENQFKDTNVQMVGGYEYPDEWQCSFSLSTAASFEI